MWTLWSNKLFKHSPISWGTILLSFIRITKSLLQLLSFSSRTNARMFRSSHRKCSVRKRVLRNFDIFTGKHLCQSLFFNNQASDTHLYWKRDLDFVICWMLMSNVGKGNYQYTASLHFTSEHTVQTTSHRHNIHSEKLAHSMRILLRYTQTICC